MGGNEAAPWLALGMHFLEAVVPQPGIVGVPCLFLTDLGPDGEKQGSKTNQLLQFPHSSLCRASTSHQARVFPENVKQVIQHAWINAQPNTQGALSESPHYTGALTSGILVLGSHVRNPKFHLSVPREMRSTLAPYSVS